MLIIAGSKLRIKSLDVIKIWLRLIGVLRKRATGALSPPPPPPPKNWLKCSKLEIINMCSKLPFFLELPTISIIYLINL